RTRHTRAPCDAHTLSLHDALPIYARVVGGEEQERIISLEALKQRLPASSDDHSTELTRSPWENPDPLQALNEGNARLAFRLAPRSAEHTSELQSPDQLVCRLLLET